MVAPLFAEFFLSPVFVRNSQAESMCLQYLGWLYPRPVQVQAFRLIQAWALKRVVGAINLCYEAWQVWLAIVQPCTAFAGIRPALCLQIAQSPQLRYSRLRG